MSRLEGVFELLGVESNRETCEAMKGLLKEGDEIVGAGGNDAVKDAAIIAAAQKVEHYEIATYGTVRTLAQHLGRGQVANLLQKTLDEEKQADQKLTEIAESTANIQSPQA